MARTPLAHRPVSESSFGKRQQEGREIVEPLVVLAVALGLRGERPVVRVLKDMDRPFDIIGWSRLRSAIALNCARCALNQATSLETFT
jgi:hypothetical protein